MAPVGLVLLYQRSPNSGSLSLFLSVVRGGVGDLLRSAGGAATGEFNSPVPLHVLFLLASTSAWHLVFCGRGPACRTGS